jgi:hypothetical protein
VVREYAHVEAYGSVKAKIPKEIEEKSELSCQDSEAFPADGADHHQLTQQNCSERSRLLLPAKEVKEQSESLFNLASWNCLVSEMKRGPSLISAHQEQP